MSMSLVGSMVNDRKVIMQVICYLCIQKGFKKSLDFRKSAPKVNKDVVVEAVKIGTLSYKLGYRKYFCFQ